MQTKHGIIDEVAMTAIWNVDPFLPPSVTLAELCAYGVDNGFTHLWITPGACITPDIPYFQTSKAEWDLLPTWELKAAPKGHPNRLRSVTGFRQKHMKAVGPARNSINIIFCGELAAWEWARRPDLSMPQAMSIIQSMEKLLGAPVSGSPGNTGWTYLKHVNEGRKNYFEQPDTDSDDAAFADVPWGQAVQNILWTRIPTDEELARPWLIRIDKNAAFPRAAYDCKFGINRVVHATGAPNMPYWTPEDTKRLPVGIWHIKPLGGPVEPHYPPMVEGEWITTPALRAALGAEYQLECDEAWLFPESHYVLRETMDKLWEYRQKFPADDPRNGAFKQIMVDLPGLFRMPELKNTPKYRPDWYSQITGGNFAIMQQNIRKFAELFGLYPILIHIDCIMYCSDKPLAELMPDNRTDMGHFKHELEAPMTDRIRGILSNPDLTSATKLAALARHLDDTAYSDYPDMWDDDEEDWEDRQEDEDE